MERRHTLADGLIFAGDLFHLTHPQLCFLFLSLITPLLTLSCFLSLDLDPLCRGESQHFQPSSVFQGQPGDWDTIYSLFFSLWWRLKSNSYFLFAGQLWHCGNHYGNYFPTAFFSYIPILFCIQSWRLRKQTPQILRKLGEDCFQNLPGGLWPRRVWQQDTQSKSPKWQQQSNQQDLGLSALLCGYFKVVN